MSGFIKRKALYHSLECEIEKTKGWIFESATVICTGTDQNVIAFQEEVENEIRDYNLD